MEYYDNELTVYGLVRDVFMALAITCFLSALHRIADALKLQGRVVAYKKVADDLAPEDREVLIHRISSSV